MKRFFSLLLLSISLHAQTIDIVTDFLGDLALDFQIIQKAGYAVRVGELQDYWKGRSAFAKDLQKILVFNPMNTIADLSYLPRNKLVLFVWEPVQVQPRYYEAFSRVYTWDDSLVDRVKFFKFYYPHLMPMKEDLPTFEKRKLCAMIASNFTFERRKMLDFFDSKPDGEFEFYGFDKRRGIAPDPQLVNHRMYRGPIEGTHSGEEKISILKNYRFCICFESVQHLRGYVTEKIFSCFAAGCIPVYWGAPNIEGYIPKTCFIDYRDFSSKEHLYYFLKTMPKETHEQYLRQIREFLKSDRAAVFSKEHFEHIVCEAAGAP